MANIDKAFSVDILSISDTMLIATGTTDPTIGVGYEAPIGSLYLRSGTGELYLKINTTDFDWSKLGPLPIPISLVGALASTGILTGGAITVNGGDPAKFNIAAGVGIIVDHTNPLASTAQLVSWPTFTAVAITNLATALQTYVAINATQNIIQSPVHFTATEHKNYIAIGWIGHVTHTSIVSLIGDPDVAFDATARLADLSRALGPFNVSGNIFSPNGTNLLINKSGGETYRLGSNFVNSNKDTDQRTDPALVAAPFYYTWRDGAGSWILGPQTTSINPNLWDNGSGVLQAIPNGRFTVQVIKYFSGVSGVTVRIEYGQTLYSNIAAAWSVLPDPFAVSNPAFTEAVTRTYLIVSAATTNLTNTTDAVFVEGAKFGSGGGGQFSGSITDLQQAYLNSPQPEIITDAVRGALTIKEGLTVGGNLFEGYDSAGVLHFSVNFAGNIFTTGTVDGRDISVDGTTLDNIKSSLGTSVSGTGSWVGFIGTNYLNAATSTTNALTILDSQITLATSDQELSRHNGVVSQTFSTVPTILLFGTSVRNDTDYTYNAGVVTINGTGMYEISFDASYTTTSNNVTTCQTSIYKNGVALVGSIAHSNHSSTTSGQQTASTTIAVPLVATNTIAIAGVRVIGGGSLVTQINGCRLNIRKLR